MPEGERLDADRHQASDREALCLIEATEAAKQALDRLHGELMLHLSGGAEDTGTPVCLQVGELRIGARDVFLGSVHGVDVFEQRSHPESHFRAGWVVTLDVRTGIATGFSLRPGDGMRFAVRDSLPMHANVGARPTSRSAISSSCR